MEQTPYIFADLQTNTLNTDFKTIDEMAEFLKAGWQEAGDSENALLNKFDLTNEEGKKRLIESYQYEILAPNQFLINQWEKQAGEAFREEMTNEEMACYLMNRGYDIRTPDNEINEDAVLEKAIEFEGYEFVLATQKWRLED